MIKSVYKSSLECFFSIFSLFAVLYSYNDLTNFISLKNSVNKLFVFIILFLFFLFYKYVLNKIKKYSAQSIIIGIFAGITNVLGRNFMLYNNLNFFYLGKIFAFIFSMLAAIGYGLIYASVFEMGWNILKNQKDTNIIRSGNSISGFIFDRHPYLYPFLLICLFWLPYLISFYPGMLQWDALHALRGYYGIDKWTNHHPVIGVLLMGYIMDIGKYLGNDNHGCAIYVILQFLLLSLTLAYIFVLFNKWNTNYYIRWCVLIIFLIHPVFPTFVMTEVKDVFYYIVVLWSLFFFIKCFENYNKSVLLGITVTSMLVCAFRKEGFFLCVILIFVLLFFRQKIYNQWKGICVSIVAGCSLAFVFSDLAINYYNVEPASMREVLSIPVQQTARYIKYHRKDITSSEWKVLDEVFQNHAKKLDGYYNPDKSDPVKDMMIYTLSKMHVEAYFKVWASHFLRHPGCYFSATVNQIYGYFYIPKEAMYKIGDCRTENFKKDYVEYTPLIKVTDNPKTERFRKAMKKYIYSWPDFPFFGCLYHPATYTWLMFFCISCFVKFRKFKYLFLYCASLAVLIICILSPCNAFIRYSYPIMLSSFILIPFSIKVVQERMELTQ